MSDREHFGVRLRRERERRRVSLAEVAEATKVSVDLWEAMERNDFSRWPSGIFARAFVRDYARVLGLDADAVVDEFCRHFPIGDRRGQRLLEAHAELLGHPFQKAAADPLPAGRNRRASDRRPVPPTPSAFARYGPRTIAAALDTACVCSLALAGSRATGAGFWFCVGAAAITYQAAATIVVGGSLGARVIDLIHQYAGPVFTGYVGDPRKHASTRST